MDKGYYQVDISDSSARLLDSGKFNLVFNIDAGPVFTINKTDLIIPDDYDPKNFTKVNYSEKIELLDRVRDIIYIPQIRSFALSLEDHGEVWLIKSTE